MDKAQEFGVMNVQLLLGLSVVVQLLAAAVALSLIRITKRPWAWLLISLAITLMAVRRGITLYRIIMGDGSPPDILAEWVALAISLFMLTGLALIIPLFRQFRRTEEALRESEQRFRKLADAAAEGIVVHEHGRVIDTNPAFARMFGYTHDEMIGMAMDDFVPPDSRVDLRKKYQEGYEKPYEHEAIRKDGLRFPVEVSGKTMTFNGRSVRVTAIQDMTERKRTQKSLLLTQFAIDHANEPMFWINRQGHFVYVNDAACRSLHYTKDELTSLCVSDIDPNFPLAAWEETWQKISRKGSLITESRHCTKEGHLFPVDIHASYLRHAEGEYICTSVRDISKQKEVEGALRESKRRLLTLFSNLPGMAYRCRNDEDWTMEFVSEGCAALTGYQSEDLQWNRTISFANVIHPDDRQRVQDGVQSALSDKHQFQLTYRIQCADGQEKWVWEQGRGIFDEKGKMSALEGFIIDITTQKLAENTLQSSYDALEERVQARTSELTNTNEQLHGEITDRKMAEDQLKHAKEVAETANRAKSIFLANMSHEIRTPISAMLAAAELLTTKPDPERIKQYPNIILRNGTHLLALVDDLLNLARAQADRLEVHPVSCSLAEILADAMAVTNPLHNRVEVELRLFYDTLIPERIETDPTRLKQAIINLIANALKFTHRGHVHVRVRLDPQHPDPRLTIVVQDTGIGIEPANLDRVFEPFTQLEPVSGDVMQGVGLGLPLSRWIAQQLGGDITVQSTRHQGSKFVLSVSTGDLQGVNMIDPDRLMDSIETPPTESESTAPMQIQGRILLADDFEDTRNLIQYALERHGASVVAVEDGQKAIDQGTTQPFDLILMDVRMPVVDGVQAVQELRRQKCLTPIIAMTASTTQRDRDRILAAGFDELWTKPIKLDDLISGVADYLLTGSDNPVFTPEKKSSTRRSIYDHPKMIQVRQDYLDQLPNHLAKLSKAVQHGPIEEAREILHQLVGSCGIHGYLELSNEAVRLLKMAKSGELAGNIKELGTIESLSQNPQRSD